MSPRVSRPPALRYRAARRTDVDTLAELAYRTYRIQSIEARREFYTEHPRFGLRDVRVGELDGEIVATLVMYPMLAFVRGTRMPVIGIGSVAVSPEHRKRGVGETLLRAALREMRQRGDAFSLLYAFRAEYYRKLGWAAIERAHQLSIQPRVLPASDEARRVRRLRLPDRPAVRALYERVASRGHFALARSDAWWDKRLWMLEGDWVVYEGRRRGQVEGYLRYVADVDRGPFALSVLVHEFVAETPEAHRGLVAHLATLGDQVREIQMAVPDDHAWLALMRTPDHTQPNFELGLFDDAGHLGHGAMLRVTDVKAALESLPVAPQSRGEVAIEVDDPVLTQNARGWRVRASEGRLIVRPETAGPGARRVKLPRLKLGIDALASVVSGALAASRAAEVGLIESAGGAAETVEPWFRARPAFLYPMNGF